MATGSVVTSAGCRNRVFTPSAPETILLSSGELASSPSRAEVPLGIDSALSFFLSLPVKLLFPVREQTDDGQEPWARPVPRPMGAQGRLLPITALRLSHGLTGQTSQPGNPVDL